MIPGKSLIYLNTELFSREKEEQKSYRVYRLPCKSLIHIERTVFCRVHILPCKSLISLNTGFDVHPLCIYIHPGLWPRNVYEDEQTRSDGMNVHLTLPWPPSVDHYWRRVGSRTLLSAKGREYKRRVNRVVRLARENFEIGSPLLGDLQATLKYSAPTRRGWDVDCYQKAPFDAMQDAGVYENDRQIRGFTVVELEPGRAWLLQLACE